MVTYIDVMQSEEFMKIAGIEALELIAKANGRSLDEAAAAFAMGAPNVVKEFERLIVSAAKAVADAMTKETN